MINAKTWNPAQIDQAIRRLEGIIRSGSYNPAELNQLLNQLGEPGYINTWNPAELDQKLRTLLYDLLFWKTATGNPIQLRTNNGGLVQSCEVTFSPIQDLHGYENPWPAGGGKNKFDVGSPRTNVNGNVTYVVKDDGTVTVNGQASSSNPNTMGFSFTLPAGTYTFSGCPSGGSDSTYRMDITELSITAPLEYGNGVTFTLTQTETGTARIRLNTNYNAQNLLFKPMIEVGSTKTDFAPYSNICPISGWNSLHLYQDTEQTETPEKTYTATFDNTEYGGSYEFVSGEGKSEWAYIASYDGETISEPWISSIDKYVEGTTPSTGAEVCYKLATPTEITLTPEEIELLTGENVLWTDGDNIEITYKKLLLPSDVETLSKKKIIEEKPKTKRSKKKKEE